MVRTFEDNLSAAASHLAWLRGFLVQGIPLPEASDFSVELAHQTLRYRSADIGETAYALLSARRVVPGAILTRALAETVAMLLVLNTDLKCDRDRAKRTAESAIWGGRLGQSPTPSINVLTIVDKADREVEHFRKMYDLLSELAHPNGVGTSHAYMKHGRPIKDELRFNSTSEAFEYTTSVMLRVCAANGVTACREYELTLRDAA